MSKYTVLLAEDEDMVRQERCEVLSAPDGARALAVSREYPDPIHLLITDLLMPGMSGIELLRQIRLERPETRVLVVSGHAGGEVLPAGVELLRKPFQSTAFRAELRQFRGQAT